MLDAERNKPDLDLTPRLDYAPPPPSRPWIQFVEDVVDPIGGWIGLAIIIGYFSLVIAPHAGMLAAIFILFGTVILQIAIVYWLKKQ